MAGRSGREYAVDMVASTETALIARSPADVFAYTSDLHNEPSWDVEVVSVAAGADEAGLEVGRRYEIRFVPFLAEAEGTLTVLEVEPGTRMVLQTDFAGLTSRITYSYAAQGAGTRFTRHVEVHPVGMLRVVAPFVTRRVRRANRRDVANLKRLLEAS